jgi:hypothetical protein
MWGTAMKNHLPWILAFEISLAVSMIGQTTPQNRTRSIQQDSQPASLASSINQGEKKISGCLRQEKGKFALEKRHHKKIWLSGPEDFATQAGHAVTLYGNFLTTSTASNGSGQRSNQGTDFQVTRIEMVSPTCQAEKSGVSTSPAQR